MILMPEKTSTDKPAISMSHTTVVCIAALFGTIDALHILDKLPEGMNAFCEHWLPLYASHTSWLLPVFMTIFVNKAFSKVQPKRVALNNN
jgi:branched-subunit amino acid permease